MTVGALYYALLTSTTPVSRTIKPSATPMEQLVIKGALVANGSSSVGKLSVRVNGNTVFQLVCPANNTVSYLGPFYINIAPNATVDMQVEGNAGTYGAVIIG